MSISLTAWLDSMEARFARDFDAFEVYLFEGTMRTFAPAVESWPGLARVRYAPEDLAEVIAPAATRAEAMLAVEEKLRTTGAMAGRTLIAITGLHLLAWLFPGGVLQPVYQWLKRGSRVVVLVAPPAPVAKLPQQARLADWREVIRRTLAQEAPNRLITGGGFER